MPAVWMLRKTLHSSASKCNVATTHEQIAQHSEHSGLTKRKFPQFPTVGVRQCCRVNANIRIVCQADAPHMYVCTYAYGCHVGRSFEDVFTTHNCTWSPSIQLPLNAAQFRSQVIVSPCLIAFTPKDGWLLVERMHVTINNWWLPQFGTPVAG